MRTKRRFLMGIFVVIVVAWAIGMGGLVLWQTTRSSSKVLKTDASDNFQPTGDSQSSKQSKFGELLGE